MCRSRRCNHDRKWCIDLYLVAINRFECNHRCKCNSQSCVNNNVYHYRNFGCRLYGKHYRNPYGESNTNNYGTFGHQMCFSSRCDINGLRRIDLYHHRRNVHCDAFNDDLLYSYRDKRGRLRSICACGRYRFRGEYAHSNSNRKHDDLFRLDRIAYGERRVKLYLVDRSANSDT